MQTQALRRLTTATLVWLSGLLLSAGCGPEYPRCTGDSDCAKRAEVCVNAMCVVCRDDASCQAKDPCGVCGEGHTCVKRAGCCRSDDECARGRCWRDPQTPEGPGECEPGCVGAECPEGTSCDATTGTCTTDDE